METSETRETLYFGGRGIRGLQADPAAVLRVPADEVPAWVLIGRGVCDATSKGDVVSPGRSDPTGEGMSCPKESLLMGVIDATTGRLLGAYRGYDLSGTWAPAQGPS